MTYAVTPRAIEIFTAFLFDSGMLADDYAEIKVEVARVVSATDEKDYIRMSRKGSTIALNRALRRDIWGLFENAKSHAAFYAWVEAA